MPSQQFRRPVQNWTAPSSYRPNPYKWVNPSLRSDADQYKADLQPARFQPRPGPSDSATFISRPADRASSMKGYRSLDFQLADRLGEGTGVESRERSHTSRSRDGSLPAKRFRGEFIVLDKYSSESDTSLATSSDSGSSLASSSEIGSDSSVSQSSSSNSTVQYSTGSESSLDDIGDCSVATPAVEAGGHEPKGTPELLGTL
ncbi:hypothetical protein DPMN_118359 [Dreissena polymorpha]|uniref:Uncharacterized protein n=2 Tax=Dreissena polymorpha TaxID=45954 RepID=A0A9D4GJY3_DREPO|nr:hypothetical protein DPMN_118359 [Dreissena polymorpha]